MHRTLPEEAHENERPDPPRVPVNQWESAPTFLSRKWLWSDRGHSPSPLADAVYARRQAAEAMAVRVYLESGYFVMRGERASWSRTARVLGSVGPEAATAMGAYEAVSTLRAPTGRPCSGSRW